MLHGYYETRLDLYNCDTNSRSLQFEKRWVVAHLALANCPISRNSGRKCLWVLATKKRFLLISWINAVLMARMAQKLERTTPVRHYKHDVTNQRNIERSTWNTIFWIFAIQSKNRCDAPPHAQYGWWTVRWRQRACFFHFVWKRPCHGTA